MCSGSSQVWLKVITGVSKVITSGSKVITSVSKVIKGVWEVTKGVRENPRGALGSVVVDQGLTYYNIGGKGKGG